MNRKKLNNDLRQKLSKIVISELLKSNGEKISDMKADKFNAAADEIVFLFPGEMKETYFMPYSSPKTGLRRPARGKLWSRYVNVKAALRIANQNIMESPGSESCSESVQAISEDIESEILFLRSATEPYPRVLSAWESTFNVRKLRYKDCGIQQVLDAFPCLKMSYGAELLESDYNQMFTDKIDVVYSEWPKISEAILKEVDERKIHPNFETDLDNSTRALLLLPYLFTPVTLKSNSKNKSNWRPTRCEIQESFIFRVKNLDDVAEIVDRRKAKLDNFNLPLQPFAVIAGETNDISCHIVFNENKYKCISSIRCLELLFKIFHALNLEYPYLAFAQQLMEVAMMGGSEPEPAVQPEPTVQPLPLMQLPTDPGSAASSSYCSGEVSGEATTCFKWSNEAILLLVYTYKSYEADFTSGKVSQKMTWEKISKVMEENNHIVSGPQCLSKFNCMKMTFRLSVIITQSLGTIQDPSHTVSLCNH
ncbi:unnamed protein product [Phaedon cochleariae]|uniref:Myb/SANT-like DNA-binding domain-containing protein n=1 Tax=Phaedon cochleariae TaxID=80249 RepID=A0A9P0GTM8_PHACE|nr:unnamed protein product [Phaedon cochleariae]